MSADSIGGRRVAMRTGATLRYLLADHLGSSTHVLDTGGNPVASQKYYPFGRLRAGDVSPYTDKQFTGHQREGDLIFMKARFYDPLAGRFLQPDTLVPDPKNPQALNRYSYVYNNPTRYTDPSGHWVEGIADATLECVVSAWCTLAAEGGVVYGEGIVVRELPPGPYIPPGVTPVEYSCNVYGGCGGSDCGFLGIGCVPVVSDTIHAAVDTTAFFGYSAYYVAYQANRGVNTLPGKTEYLIKLGPGFQLYVLSLEAQVAGLAVNVAADATETYVLGVDEPVLDDRTEKPLIPSALRPLFDVFGIPIPVVWAPGIDQERNIDFAW